MNGAGPLAALIAASAALLVLAGCSAGLHEKAKQVSASASAALASPPTSAVPTYGYQQVAVSESCLADIKLADKLNQTDVGQEPAPGDAPINASATDCATVDEWESALHQYPGALGLANASYLDPSTDVFALCAQSNASAPVCQDARSLGIGF